MRVVVFAPAPWDTVTGGYVYDRAIVDGLRAAGHEVTVATLAGSHPLPDAAARDAAAAAWHSAVPGWVPVIDGLCLPAFETVAGWPRAVGLIHHPTALETGRTEAARAALRDIECRMLPQLARCIVTSGDTESRLVAAFGVAAAKVSVVEPGTAPAPRSPGPAQQDMCRILSVASLIPRKGHDVLLRALARLPDIAWHLTIAGAAPDPAYGESLRQMARDLGIGDRVTFAGEVTGPALDALWHEAGLFAMATHYEGYGMAIAEALRRGLPVAVTSGGAAASLVAPECGVVCPPGDDEGLSRAMRRVIFDRALRLDLAEAAWQIGARLPDWPAQARRFAAALEQA